MVAFDPGTSPDARIAAFDKVNGTVVGGVRINDEVEGAYYLQVPATTPELVLAVSDSVAASAGVVMAIPIVNDTVSDDYRRPIDGNGATDWQLDPANADGANWALESIAAPFAWGCSTGDASTRVAVLDAHFHEAHDLASNVVGITHYVPMSDLNRHGLAVASIIGARGNNQEGTSGVMWNASLQLYDRELYSSIMRDGLLRDVIRMMDATAGGARVVNVSGHLNFPSADVIPDSPAGRAYMERRVLPALRWALRFRNGSATAPLFVFSAGNGDVQGIGRNAYFNGFPAIEAEFPSRVLVVAATQ